MLQYDVFYNDQKVGNVEILTEGLYYRIRCQCDVFTDAVCKLAVASKKGSKEIGVLVPNGRYMGLIKKVAIKSIGKEIDRFLVYQKAADRKRIVVPVELSKPFSYISQLADAKLLKNIDNNEIQLSISQE